MAWLITAGVFCALVMSLIAYAVISNKQSEDCGFMKHEGSKLYWLKESIPVHVYVEPKTVSPENVQTACEWINQHFMKPLLQYEGVRPVDVSLDEYGEVFGAILCDEGATANNKPAHAGVRFNSQGMIISCRIVFNLYRNTDQELAQMKHELGHALGLKHDQHEDSIMNPRPYTPYTKLLDGDIERLKETYLS